MYSRHFSQGRSNGSRNATFRRLAPRGRRPIPDLDIEGFIKRASVAIPKVVEAEPITINTFDDFNLKPQIVAAIQTRGYKTPTPIQAKSIPVILDGKDLLGLANTGTGKTGAFLIPMIQHLLENPQAKTLIVAPTRELALQIGQEFRALSRGLNLFAVMCIGGTSMYRQRDDLRFRYQVIIGTPGRIKDLMEQRLLQVFEVDYVVLDEVDRMLDMGFVHDMRAILRNVPSERQSLFFSATITPTILALIREFSKELITASVKKQELTASVDQAVIPYVDGTTKVDILHDLLIKDGVDKVLIFGRTKHGVHRLSRQLTDRGFRADSIHGNKTQPQRQRVLTQFRQNRINILVATDVAARGLDIADITHVINFDSPATYEDYVHRIGRTGRGDKRGVAWTLIERMHY